MALTLSGDDGLAGVNGSATTPAIQGTDTNTGLTFGTDTVNVVTGGSTRATVDSSGRLLVGTSTAATAPNDLVQINTTSGVSIHRGEDSAAGPRLDFQKSRNATHGSNTVVQSGDLLGSIFFRGDDGTDYNTAGAQIFAAVDGTPGANDMPGRLVFSTAADGASSPTERMRLDSSGNLKFNSGYGSVATAYGVRAWVCFNGTGTIAIKNDGNVSSLTDLDTGKYRINFTNSMPDVNYCTCASIIGSPSSSNPYTNSFVTTNENSGSVSTGHIEIRVIHTSAGLQDHSNINVAVIR